jgi:hypothetical protein
VGGTSDQLTAADYDLILESLLYMKEHFIGRDGQPSEEARRQRIADVDSVIEKVRGLRPVT